jgi:SNF2 family DNA or RNA helicase
VENTLTDLWCLFDFIQPGLLGALTDFGNTYRRPIEAETDEERVRVEELRKIIEPQTLRRIKADVAKDLPLKVVDSNCRALTISPRQRSLYAQGIASFRTATTSAGESNLRSHLGLLSYLRAVCSDPRPPGRAMPELQSIAELEEHSPKMAWMLSQLQSIRDRGEKVIVFCEFRELQRTLQRAIAERLDVSADIINGDTPAASVHADNRQKRIKKFQETEGFGVIILSPLAVGFGLNIQAANHVIHFTRTWNPAREDQATDRAYRIGQTKDVHVYYPVVVAEDFTTFDQKLDQLLETKRKLSQDMLNGCGDVGSSDFADLHDPTGGALFDMKPVT